MSTKFFAGTEDDVTIARRAQAKVEARESARKEAQRKAQETDDGRYSETDPYSFDIGSGPSGGWAA